MEKVNYNSYAGKLRTNSNIAWHRPQSDGCRVEDELMQKSQRALGDIKDPLEKLRLLCLVHGACGIIVLCRIFRKMYGDGNKQLSKKEFENAIKKSQLELTDQDVDDLFAKFDTQNNGFIHFHEFLHQVRPPMSKSRQNIVEQAFRKLDKAGDGLVTVKEIENVYANTCNPRYMSGEDSADTTMNKFLANFEQDEIADGTVTLEEFMDYYSGISVSIDNDGYFDLMMRQAYKL